MLTDELRCWCYHTISILNSYSKRTRFRFSSPGEKWSQWAVNKIQEESPLPGQMTPMRRHSWKCSSWSTEVRPSMIHSKALTCSIVTMYHRTRNMSLSLYLSLSSPPLPLRCAAAGIYNTFSPGFRAGLAFLCFLLTTIKNLKHQFYWTWMISRHWPQNRHATKSPGAYSDKEDVARGLELPPQLPMKPT